MQKEAETKIKQALILLENNNHLSASKFGIEGWKYLGWEGKRHINRTTAIAILLDVIDMTPEEFKELYNNNV